MIEDFQNCLDFVLRMEGGFSDNPDDHGGATNHGIIQTEYDSYRRKHGLALQSVRDISGDEVSDIYKTNYWAAIHGDFVAMPLCLVLFDTAVNCGSGRAYEFLNEALGLEREMTWTDETSARYHALTATQIEEITKQILALRKSFYERIAHNPGQSQFLRGWLNRLDSLRQACGL